jgi:hypothetical protein
MSIIAAGNTTTTALVQTADTTGNLVFTTGGANTTALTLSNAQAATFAGAVTAPSVTTTGSTGSVNSINTFGFKNRIINGTTIIAQRGNVAAVNATYTYGGADRILVSVNSLTSGTIQQIQSGVAGGISGYAQAVQATTSTTGSVFFQTRLESANVIDLNSKSVTISCKVYQDTGSTLTGTIYLYKPTTTIDTFSAQTLLSSTTASIPSSTLTTVTLTYTLGATEASLGLAPTFSFAVPSAVSAKYFTITDWQLEVGSQATSFDFRDYGRELILCQRYYETIGADGTGGLLVSGNPSSAQQINVTIQFKITKRTTSTVTKVGTWLLTQASQPGIFAPGVDAVLLYTTSTTGGSCLAQNTAGAYLTVSAEL